MKVVIASTIAGYKCNGKDELYWLNTAELLMGYPTYEAQFFCAIQTGQGREERFQRLRNRLKELNGTIWTFSVHDGETQVTNRKRIADICTGRNLCVEFAIRQQATHILFLDSDLKIPGNCIRKLAEVKHPVVGGNVPSYCLDGPTVLENWPEHLDPPPFPIDADLREHWNTAGFLLCDMEVFRTIRWRHDFDHGVTDDPAFASDLLLHGFGYQWVRHDVIGVHTPLVPVEERGHDLSIRG